MIAHHDRVVAETLEEDLARADREQADLERFTGNRRDWTACACAGAGTTSGRTTARPARWRAACTGGNPGWRSRAAARRAPVWRGDKTDGAAVGPVTPPAPAPRTDARGARRPWSPGSGSRRAAASSPGSGRWPISRVTMPPMVSNSSSLNSLPKRSLKSAIGVSALTRKWPSGCGWISVVLGLVDRRARRRCRRRSARARPRS